MATVILPIYTQAANKEEGDATQDGVSVFFTRGQIRVASCRCYSYSLGRCLHLSFGHADEGKDGKVLALTIKKRRGEKDTTSWWSGVLEGDDAW